MEAISVDGGATLADGEATLADGEATSEDGERRGRLGEDGEGEGGEDAGRFDDVDILNKWKGVVFQNFRGGGNSPWTKKTLQSVGARII
jgi:hypothetical protein